MKNIIEKILFVKPFEIESSYSSFSVIWKNIKKVLASADGIYASALVRSVDSNSKYGFVSFSAWDTKASFSKAVNDNTVLKYHISKNGEEKESDYLYLYRVMKHDITESGKNGNELLLINFIKGKIDNEKDVIKYWNEITNIFKSENIIQNSYLCKSIYRFSKFRYIILMNIKNFEPYNLLFDSLIKKNNSFKMRDSHFSIYNNNLKKNIFYNSNLLK